MCKLFAGLHNIVKLKQFAQCLYYSDSVPSYRGSFLDSNPGSSQKTKQGDKEVALLPTKNNGKYNTYIQLVEIELC